MSDKDAQSENRHQQPIIDVLQELGYEHIRFIEPRGFCGIIRMIYTVGLVSGLDQSGYQHRWCYPDWASASHALSEWNGISDPPGDWIKHKGKGGDYSNPNKDGVEAALLKADDKVHYIPFPDCSVKLYENGIVKTMHSTNKNVLFVVYHCAGDWDNYQRYTGALTDIAQLRKGWI